jgi:hypothetical protein
VKFEVIHKGEVIETKEFGEGSYKIGRVSTCDIYLKSPNVSKQHAMLVIKGNRAAIVDMGSSNGVFVNGILVKKQRIEEKDEVVISDFKIRIAQPEFKPKKASARPSAPSSEGNLARDMSFEESPIAEAAPQMNPQEKLLFLVDQKVLTPFYAVLKNFDWRMLLLMILSGALVSAVLLSVIPIVRWGRNITTQEALARAHTVVSQTVRENYRILSKTNDFTRLTTEAAESEPGIISVFILDPKSSTVLAPTKLLNKEVSDVYALIAIKKIQEGKEDVISIEKENGIYVVAQPIYLFSQEQNDRTLQAVVMAEFEVPAKVHSTYEPLVEAALFAILCSLLAYFLIFKMFTYPIISMQEQLDAALKGEDVTITSAAKLPELETLATVINFTVSRMKQGGGGLSGAVVSTDPVGEDESYEKTIEEFDQGTDALLLLDKDKKVRYVGRVLEDLLGMRNQYAKGQNISDACKDQAFAGTCIDLAERVVSTLGEVQYSTLDINGTGRSIVAFPHRSQSGDIRFTVVVVKMGGA